MRHDRARSFSYGIICLCICLWGRSMKRFMVVSLVVKMRISHLFPATIRRSFSPTFQLVTVRAYTISGHVGAKLSLIPGVGALLTGGGVGVDETEVREL